MIGPLDRQIAELKGWRLPTVGEHMLLVRAQPMHIFPPEYLIPLKFPDSPPWHYTDAKDCRWSTSDSKALELVDEWCAFAPGNMVGITVNPEYGAGCTFVRNWGVLSGGIQVSSEQAPTRAEAICRAYIAAVTWLNSRKTEV